MSLHLHIVARGDVGLKYQIIALLIRSVDPAQIVTQKKR